MDEFLNDGPSIKDYVLADEKLLWTGKPVREIKLLPSEKIVMIFGAFWTVFSAFWITMAYVGATDTENDTMANILPFFGLPFLLVGLYLMIISPIRAKIKHKSLEYALTTKRVMIFYNGKCKVLQTFKYNEIHNISFGCDEEGVGVVTFLSVFNTSVRGDKLKIRSRRTAETVYGFYNIDNVKKVYRIFCERIGEK